MRPVTTLAERGFLPEPVLRLGIRAIVRRRLREEASQGRSVDDWVKTMADGEIAIATDAANAQHYEVPADFFRLVLGPRLKYSGAFWPAGVTTLAAAEEAMLDLTIERADLEDGLRILELGCGWGSLSLRMAERFPQARIVAVSNSRGQREFIEGRARMRGLTNITALTADMNTFVPSGEVDRVVSVEMFEHMRNWQALIHRIHRWLGPNGALFVHVFTHARYAYPFETTATDDWMGRHFFTGGMMPSDDLLLRIAEPFTLDGHWRFDGMHYARTAEAWHANLMNRRADVLEVLARFPAADDPETMFGRWRLFFLACAELFGYRNGTEWLVSHYRLRKTGEGA